MDTDRSKDIESVTLSQINKASSENQSKQEKKGKKEKEKKEKKKVKVKVPSMPKTSSSGGFRDVADTMI